MNKGGYKREKKEREREREREKERRNTTRYIGVT